MHSVHQIKKRYVLGGRLWQAGVGADALAGFVEKLPFKAVQLHLSHASTGQSNLGTTVPFYTEYQLMPCILAILRCRAMLCCAMLCPVGSACQPAEEA